MKKQKYIVIIEVNVDKDEFDKSAVEDYISRRIEDEKYIQIANINVDKV